MFSKVLLATDCSPISFEVVKYAAALKAWGTKQVLLLQCLNLQELPEEVLAPSQDFLRHQLDEQKAFLVDQGFDTEVEVRPGMAKIEINRAAEEHQVSLIVVGAHGHSFSREILLGGVAGAVIHSATKPVLVVKGFENKSSSLPLLDHVLFPTDFSAPAHHAMNYLRKLIDSGAQKVTLIHVQDKSRIDPHLTHRLSEFNTIDEERLKTLRSELHAHADIAIETLLTYGHPVTDIVTAVQEKSVSLVAMASQGKGYLAEMFLGSISHQVSRHSPVSVLLFPTPRNVARGT